MTEYGSTIREAMKRSMEKPAAFKPTNVRQPEPARMYAIVVFSVLILWLGIMGVFLIDKVEGLFR